MEKQCFNMCFFYPVAIVFTIMTISVTPPAWATKEVSRRTESYTLIESLYGYLNPLNAWPVSFMVLETGLADVFCRCLVKKQGAANPKSLLTVFASLSLPSPHSKRGQHDRVQKSDSGVFRRRRHSGERPGPLGHPGHR